MSKLNYHIAKAAFLLAVVGVVAIGQTHAQFVNDGADVTIQSNAVVHIQGDFVHQDGFITNMGTIEVGNDWVNNGNSNPISDSEGSVNLVGSNQAIIGLDASAFNQLTLSGQGAKTLGQDVQVNDVIDLGDATLALNEQRLTIDNSVSSAIVRASGWLISESDIDLGRLQWNIGEASGAYTIPFGDVDSYLPVTFDITANGVGDGSFSFATYPTSVDNQPLPSGVLNLDVNGVDDSLQMVDRFWVIEESNYMSVPTVDIQFTYDVDDILAPNTINPDSLQFARWNGGTTWLTFPSTVNADEVAVTGIDEFGNFTLRSMSGVSNLIPVRAPTADFTNYPNPVKSSSFLTIEVESEANSSAHITLLDSQGRIVSSTVESVSIGGNLFDFDVPSISTGLYLLRVELNGKVGTRKISIN
jgi:hypothetical protein